MKSHLDPSRDTVGSIANKAAQSDYGLVEAGAMVSEIIPDLITDINEALLKPCDGPFFLLMTEKKDLQIKNAVARTFKHLDYRPYPEDNTTVFWKNPKTQELRFCWDLPHWSEMDNILYNWHLYEPELINHITAWKKNDLTPFGFYYHKELKWIPNPDHEDRRLEAKTFFASNKSVS